MKEKCDMTDVAIVDVECTKCTSTAHATPLTPEPRNTAAQELKEAVNTRRLSETIDKLFRNDGSRQGQPNTKSIKDMKRKACTESVPSNNKRKCINKQPSCIVEVVCMPKGTMLFLEDITKRNYKMLE